MTFLLDLDLLKVASVLLARIPAIQNPPRPGQQVGAFPAGRKKSDREPTKVHQQAWAFTGDRNAREQQPCQRR
jgi:hypothetical protein